MLSLSPAVEEGGAGGDETVDIRGTEVEEGDEFGGDIDKEIGAGVEFKGVLDADRKTGGSEWVGWGETRLLSCGIDGLGFKDEPLSAAEEPTLVRRL